MNRRGFIKQSLLALGALAFLRAQPQLELVDVQPIGPALANAQAQAIARLVLALAESSQDIVGQEQLKIVRRALFGPCAPLKVVGK